jgi:acyl-CoA thioester hydrolase
MGAMVEIRVPFADTDAMGIVHHANYLKYFEVARVGFMRSRGIDYRTWQARGQHLPLVESHVRYKKPARFEDILEILVIPRRDGLRIIFDYELKNKETGILLATGQTQHVCVNENLKVIEPTDDIVSALTGE